MAVPHILAGTAGGTTAQLDANWAYFADVVKVSGSNVSIATTDVQATLTVDGTASTLGQAIWAKSDVAASPTFVAWNNAAAGDNKFFEFYTEAAASLRGFIGYNRAGGLVAYSTTSDYRAKTIHGDLCDAGSVIDALHVYSGTMLGADMARPMFIAHEVEAVAPYAVTGRKDAVGDDGAPIFQQLDVSSLVPLLVAELQSLRARLAALEG